MSQDSENADVAKELPRLVSSNKVEGTPVLSRDGDRLGTVAAFLIDRFSGQVDYVVATKGGVLGIGAVTIRSRGACCATRLRATAMSSPSTRAC